MLSNAAGDGEPGIARADGLRGLRHGPHARGAGPVARRCPLVTPPPGPPAPRARATRARSQAPPSGVAGTAARPPFIAPIGVRTPATITASLPSLAISRSPNLPNRRVPAPTRTTPAGS